MVSDLRIDRQFFSCDSGQIPWQRSRLAHGVGLKNLGRANGYAMKLVRFEPGATFSDHYHPGPEFISVLDGEVVQNGRRLYAACVGVTR
jgi:anti-sigma factor ChrR (cupin superfamily)